MTDIYKFLEDHYVQYERHAHPSVYTVEGFDRLIPAFPAAKTKYSHPKQIIL